MKITYLIFFLITLLSSFQSTVGQGQNLTNYDCSISRSLSNSFDLSVIKDIVRDKCLNKPVNCGICNCYLADIVANTFIVVGNGKTEWICDQVINFNSFNNCVSYSVSHLVTNGAIDLNVVKGCKDSLDYCIGLSQIKWFKNCMTSPPNPPNPPYTPQNKNTAVAILPFSPPLPIVVSLPSGATFTHINHEIYLITLALCGLFMFL